MTMALTLLFFLAASFSLLQAAAFFPLQDGNTLDTKARRLLSGDHTGPQAPVASLVSWRASPPPVGSSQIWGVPPSRPETKAMYLPSGE